MTQKVRVVQFLEKIRSWRTILSPILTLSILLGFILWVWGSRQTVGEVLDGVGFAKIILISLCIIVSIFFAAWSFTLLVRGMGYSFRWIDSYHFLNLALVASLLPGGVWGYASLAVLLWSRQISKRDGVLVVILHTILMLSAAALVGILGLISTIGWIYTIIGLLPLLFLIFGKPWLQALYERFYRSNLPLPSTSQILVMLLVGSASWISASIGLAILVYGLDSEVFVSPMLIASAYSAGYIIGYLSIFAPSGLGIREGVIGILLGHSIGFDKALSLAIVFRIIQTLVIWINVSVTLVVTASEKKVGNNNGIQRS